MQIGGHDGHDTIDQKADKRVSIQNIIPTSPFARVHLIRLRVLVSPHVYRFYIDLFIEFYVYSIYYSISKSEYNFISYLYRSLYRINVGFYIV